MVNAINTAFDEFFNNDHCALVAHGNHYGTDCDPEYGCHGSGPLNTFAWENTLFSSLKVEEDDEDWRILSRPTSDVTCTQDAPPGTSHTVYMKRYPRFKFASRPIVRGSAECFNEPCIGEHCTGNWIFFPELYTDWTGTYNLVSNLQMPHYASEGTHDAGWDIPEGDEVKSFCPTQLNFLPNEPTPPNFGEVSVDFT